MHDTVVGSIQIQKAIGLLHDWETDFKVLPWDKAADNVVWGTRDTFHGLRYYDFHKTLCGIYDSRYTDVAQGYIPDPRTWKGAEFALRTAAASLDSLSKLGSRCQSLSPCQPPVKRMIIQYLCKHCQSWGDRPKVLSQLWPSNGEYITIGDIYRVNAEARKIHRTMTKCLDPNAKGKISIEFEGEVRLRKDDPIMLGRRDPRLAVKKYRFYGDYEEPEPEEDEESMTKTEQRIWGDLDVI